MLTAKLIAKLITTIFNRQRSFLSGVKRYSAQTASQSIGVAPMSFFLLCTSLIHLLTALF